MSGWKKINPETFGGEVIPFSQKKEFKWMEVSTLTEDGCCMAMTVCFFQHCHQGKEPNHFFDWLRGPRGRSTVIKLQTTYIASSKAGGTLATALKALVRMVEDQKLVEAGFTKVDSPWFPVVRFAALPDDATQRFSGAPVVYKTMYLSNLSNGTAHAMGFVLDETNGRFIFFDPNQGIARFNTIELLKTWLVNVFPMYDKDWSGYFLDTWKM